MYIVFDIGGTNMRIASSSDGTTIGEPVIIPTPRMFDDAIDALTETARTLADNQPITTIAGGLPGPLNKEKTHLLKAPNIPDWNNKPIKQRIEQELNTTVFLENDTAMIGTGEALEGAGKDCEIMAYITVSTGLGGCRIVHGKPAESAYGFEPGHHIIDLNGPLCGCDMKGHLESLVSGAALEKQNGTKPENIEDANVWDHTARYPAAGLNNVLMFWSPETIVLGGSLMKSININAVQSYFDGLVTIFPHTPPLHHAELGEKGGLIGALAYIKAHQ